jgi:8-oxo-dGTP pyrophosphatase MutT (NUDIX family)
MVPKSIDLINHSPVAPLSAIPCSVLLILKKKEDNLAILLTLRSKSLKNHQHQLSFPGGKLEFGESPEMGSLRETFEETGIKTNQLNLIGRLSPLYIAHTNMQIQPIVAELIADESELHITESEEVEEVFWASLSDLSDDNLIRFDDKIIRGIHFHIPFWEVHTHVPLWGATAMMISELVELYKEFQQQQV